MEHWHRGILAAIMPAATSVASGHIISTAGAGLGDGLLHPLSGFDHVLAMVAVGIWAAQLGGRALWTVPATFVSMMLVGGVLGFSGVVLPQVDVGIAASLVLLGLLITTATRLRLLASMSIVGLFAMFHGHAHGIEAPLAAAPALYALGFVTATVGLHLLGITLGHVFGRWNARLLRVGGFGILAVGTWTLGSV